MFETYILPSEWAEKQTSAHGCQTVRHACDTLSRTRLARIHESVRYPGLAPLRRLRCLSQPAAAAVRATRAPPQVISGYSCGSRPPTTNRTAGKTQLHAQSNVSTALIQRKSSKNTSPQSINTVRVRVCGTFAAGQHPPIRGRVHRQDCWRCA